MKAKVKDTGEVVNVRPCNEPMNMRCAFYETEQGRKFPMFALEFEKEIDWEQRRYEIAKELFSRLVTHPDWEVRAFSCKEKTNVIKDCIRDADALIAELQKGGEQ